MNKRAIDYIIKLFVQRALGITLYLLGASWTMQLRSWVYFAIYFTVAAVSAAVMYHANPETLAERNKIDAGTPKWDKVLVGIFWPLSFFVIYFVAGFEASHAPPPGAVFWTGIALQIPVAAVSLWAAMANPFLESTARIQTDRKQVVSKGGPYRFVRHPAYTSILLWCAAVAMVFETLWVAVIAVVIAVIIIIRTYLEDQMLKAHLAGYAEYAGQVRYRLVPLVW